MESVSEIKDKIRQRFVTVATDPTAPQRHPHGPAKPSPWTELATHAPLSAAPAQATRLILSILVPPGAPMGSPAVMAYTSPEATTP